MAVGPFMRILAQVVVPVVAVLARALPKAYGEALRNARKAGVDSATAASASNMLRKTISKSEALQILNLTETEATAEAVQKRYEKYMAANDISKGGSFYLQSKVYRAKELLDEYMEEERLTKKDKPSPQTSSSSSSSSTEESRTKQQSSSDNNGEEEEDEEENKNDNKKKSSS